MIKRRTVVAAAAQAGAAALLATTVVRAAPSPLRIALLHFAPAPGDLAANRAAIEAAAVAAAKAGASWVVTPELSVSGYAFAERIGTDWIQSQPDTWTTEFCALVARLGITAFLTQPERDAATGKLYNTTFVISRDGTIAGKYRKAKPLRVGSEAWSTPGDTLAPIALPEFGKVGVLICADAYFPEIAQTLADQGAEVLVSPAAWSRGLHEPSGEWERCTRDTGLPMIVCNRTGVDALDFRAAESVAAHAGRRVLTLSSATPTIFMVDWQLNGAEPFGPDATRIALSA